MSAVFELIVVGGGHAGLEAALAAARMGARVALVTLESRAIGRMSCNPAIGGLGKGQMVREIDALGGEMGRAADDCGIQFRMLNTRKGPAVRAPRAQCDKHRYQERMVALSRSTPGLTVVEGRVDDLLLEPVGSSGSAPGEEARARVLGVVLAEGSELWAPRVILNSGTFLRGLLHCGFDRQEGGRIGEQAAVGLSVALTRIGFESGRLKTGTPPRVEASSVDWTQTTPQPGDVPPTPFSHFTTRLSLPQVPCHTAYTTPRTHDIIRENLHRSPLYTGVIEGIGPRYCPSIEDKVVRFADRERHQVFLEPEGLDTSWIYLNGISTSLPRDVQEEIVRSIPALRSARILQHGYAVEYDFFPPTQIRPTLETRAVAGLYFAGQICGTSGYEEAAGQGILAGINAVLSLRGEAPFQLDRSEAYLGVLVDDLVTECPREPYRMFTSRAEHRLLLRADNADERLFAHGRRLGLIPDAAMRQLDAKRAQVARGLELLSDRKRAGKGLLRILRQPEMTLQRLGELEPEVAALQLRDDEALALEVEVKYATYIERERVQVERLRRMESWRIPEDFDYAAVVGIRAESRDKLSKVRPVSLGQASRISGVTPADLNVICVYLERAGGRRAGRAS